MSAPLVGPIAGGPWHDKALCSRVPVIRCPIRPEEYAALPWTRDALAEFSGIKYAEYHWHHAMRMWIWHGPNVPVRKA